MLAGIRLIVGLDFSGNPTKRSFEDYVSVFTEARRRGFKYEFCNTRFDNRIWVPSVDRKQVKEIHLSHLDL